MLEGVCPAPSGIAGAFGWWLVKQVEPPWCGAARVVVVIVVGVDSPVVLKKVVLKVGRPRTWWCGASTLFGVVRRCPTLPHPHECSTIGAVGLSFRVRNGTGRFPHAMTTVTRSPTL